MSLVPFFEWLQTQGVDLDSDQKERFEGFQARLYEANEVMNLTRIPLEECWVRHFADSLLFVDRFARDRSVLDIGTGPGFPAWPIACARPDLKVTAVDSNGKMLGFLRSDPLPNLEIVQIRAEDWDVRDRFDYVTGRALAPLPLQLELSAPFCRVEGVVVPMRTPNEQLEPFDLRILSLRLTEVESRKLPGTEIERLMPTYLKVRPTPMRFPRRWADMKTKPIE